MTAAGGWLMQLARRAVAAPEVRPRLASRFESAAAAEPAMPAWPGPAVERPAAPESASPARTPVAAMPPPPPHPAATDVPVVPAPAWRAPVPPGPAPLHAEVQALPRPAVDGSAPRAGPPAPATAAAALLEPAPRAVPWTPPPDPPARPRDVESRPGPPAEPAVLPRLRVEALAPLLIPPPPAPAALPVAAAVAPRGLQPVGGPLPARRDAAAAPPPPAIEITIGRIDVRAMPEPQARGAPLLPAAAPRGPGLADYLRRRGP